ncbi:hypothetical protein GOP47_0029973 [Adiantum capillus-veneris]|nr:hypothetical protein GOP47_0029973 [Adiantum capillus-veneris]
MTCRQQALLALFSSLSLSFIGFFSLFHKSVEISAANVSNLPSFQGNLQRIKHTQLVLGQAAGEGIPGRVQCRVANNETDSPHEFCSLSNAERVSFITFFVSNNELPSRMEKGANSGTVVFRNVTISKLDRPHAVLSVFLKSVQISNPSSTQTILTSESADLFTTKLPGDVHVARIGQNFTRSNLMLQRLEAYAYFLGELLEARLQASMHARSVEHVVFMDADIIVVDDFGCLFETYKDFDIALTFRNNKDQPINSGVIVIRGETESLSRARSFLLNVVKVYRERFSKAARMLGDQLSLAAVVQEHSEHIGLRFRKPSVFVTQILQMRVLFLPSQLYNWTPSEGAGQFHGMPKDVKVLHFKGSRKRLMLEAWNLFIQSGGSLLDMECLILRSGRTNFSFEELDLFVT